MSGEEEAPVVWALYMPMTRAYVINGVYCHPNEPHEPFTDEEMEAYKLKYPEDFEPYVEPEDEYGPWNVKFKARAHIIGPHDIERIKARESFKLLESEKSTEEKEPYIYGTLDDVPVVLVPTHEGSSISTGTYVKGTED